MRTLRELRKVDSRSPYGMTRKASLHFIDRAVASVPELGAVWDLPRAIIASVYGDLSELWSTAAEGIIHRRATTAKEGGVGMILERLSRLGIWLPA